jgi:hypothetical protein
MSVTGRRQLDGIVGNALVTLLGRSEEAEMTLETAMRAGMSERTRRWPAPTLPA